MANVLPVGNCTYFEVENLEIEPFVTNLNNNINTESLDEIIEKYEGHPSILKIRENVNVENKSIFNDATLISFREVIGQLDPKKAGIENDIPTKILIQSKDIVCGYLSNICNNSKNKSTYLFIKKQKLHYSRIIVR